MVMQNTAKWTFMVYLAGDNNLSGAGDKDLGEMRTVGSTPDVNVVAEIDRAGPMHETMRYHIQKDGINETTLSRGETDSGDPQVLTNFVDWAVKEYPAERYGLILWNHGNGWAPTEIDRIATKEVHAKDYNLREGQQRSTSPISRALFRTTLQSILGLETPIARAICCDDGSGHSLDMIELGHALEHVTATTGQPLDLLGMDACLMSNLEVAYQCQNFAHFMVASEESEPGDGWPYGRVLSALVNDPDQDGASFGAKIVSEYIDSYLDIGFSGAITQSAFDLSMTGMLADTLDHLADVLIPRLPEAEFTMWKAQSGTPSFWHLTLWDIKRFCQGLIGASKDQDVIQAAKAVIDALIPGQDSFLLAEGHNGSSVKDCGGSSIYMPLPVPGMDISRYYEELDFSQQHRWIDLLYAYHGLTREATVGAAGGTP